MSNWERVEADEAMAARIKVEYGQIHAHLGDEAPDPATEIEPMAVVLLRPPRP